MELRFRPVQLCLLRGLALMLVSLLSLPTLAAKEEPLRVVTSIRPLALLVEEVAGDLADVKVLLSASASPHHYSLRVSDMRSLSAADLLVWVGPEFERFLSGPAAERSEDRSLALAKLPGIGWQSVSRDSTHHHAERDMHIWLNPRNGSIMMDAIAERLIELKPQAANQVRENLALAQADLKAASESVAAELAPLADRSFGVSHDGFGHFVAHFGLRQKAAVSALSEQGLSARHLASVVKELKGARCLLVEASEAPENVQRLEQVLRLPAVTADPLAADPAIGDYAALIEHLGASFVRCLAAK